MNKKKLYNFLIFIPFAIAIGSFILYFRYLFIMKGASKITALMETSVVRYRNIGLFCLALGVFLLFLKTLINYFRIDDEIEVRNERVLDRISSKQDTDIKYSFNENNIINDLLNNQELKAVFYNGKVVEKAVKFKNYNKEDNVIEFYDLSKDKVIMTEPIKNEYVKQESYDSKNFKKCYKCKNIIARDSVMCVHCGTVLKPNKLKEKKKNVFNPIVFAINLIVILICIILILLCFNVISKKLNTNRSNLNIKTVQTI